MKAAYIREVGPAENIVYGDLPQPELKGSHVLVKVAAVSVNPVDTYIRGGKIAWELPKPFVLGCDLAGTVEAVGPNVTRLKPGDRVWGSNQGLKGRQGTFAEYAAVDESWLYSTPPSVADRDAAAIAWWALRPTWASSATPSSAAGKRSSSMADRAEWGRASCRWPRPWAPGDHHRRERRKGGGLPASRRRRRHPLQDSE